MTARLDIIVGQARNALCVPIAAIKTDAQGSYVEKIIKDEKGKPAAEKVYLTIGMYGEEYVEVSTDNLREGDEVSVTYKAAKTPTNAASANNNSRRGGMGGPPPF